jgi:hypothetical protein
MRKNKLSLFTLALASLLWLSACEEEVAGGGGGDTTPTPDCLGDEICFCQTTADCPAGLSCEAGRCGLGGDPRRG